MVISYIVQVLVSKTNDALLSKLLQGAQCKGVPQQTYH